MDFNGTTANKSPCLPFCGERQSMIYYFALAKLNHKLLCGCVRKTGNNRRTVQVVPFAQCIYMLAMAPCQIRNNTSPQSIQMVIICMRVARASYPCELVIMRDSSAHHYSIFSVVMFALLAHIMPIVRFLLNRYNKTR